MLMPPPPKKTQPLPPTDAPRPLERRTATQTRYFTDFANAIYAELTSPQAINYALELWHEGRGLLTERDRFDLVLPVLARSAIEAALDRWLREATRT